MKKKLLSAALILTALVSFNISAQEPANTDTGQPETTSTRNIKADKKDKAKHDGRRGHRHGDCDRKDSRHGKQSDCKGQRPDFFQGITLTADQQTKLEALRPARQERAEGTEAKGDKKNCQENRGKEGRHRRHKGMNAEYVGKVKEILTPEQYVVFLENIVLRPGKDAGCSQNGTCRNGHNGRTACPEAGNTPDTTTK